LPEKVSRAAVLVGRERLEIREFPLPKIGPTDGLLKVEAAGICGSDWAQFLGTMTALPETYPVIPGHEIAGRVHQVGKEAAARWGVSEGDQVVVGMTVPDRGVYGITIPVDVPPALWGGYADYMYLDKQTVVHRLPKDVAPDLAALYVPVSNGVKWACFVPGLQIGDTIVIQGPGQQGLGCVVAAKEAGASLIIVIGARGDTKRLEIAAALGADVTIDISNTDPVEAVAEVTGGRLADIVVDVSAEATSPVALALDMVREGGQVVLAGLKSDAPIPNFVSDKIVLRGLVVRGSNGARGYPPERPHKAIEKALAIITSGRYPLDLLCTHQFALDDAERAVRVVGRDVVGEDSVHVTIQPGLS
jgi:threonine dehydrogenase-like Zn-dependent dehydrogenase